VGIFRPSFQVFVGIADALGLLEADSATTQYENGPVKPRLDVALSIQKTAVWREFIFSRTDIAGGATTSVDLDFYDSTGGNWDEIFVRNSSAILDTIPAGHEAIVVEVGADTTVTAAFTSLQIARRRVTAGVGGAHQTLFFGDTPDSDLTLTRNATHDSPILMPLPWYFPVPAISDQVIRARLVTLNATVTNLMFNVLSAPPGVFSRIP